MIEKRDLPVVNLYTGPEKCPLSNIYKDGNNYKDINFKDKTLKELADNSNKLFISLKTKREKEKELGISRQPIETCNAKQLVVYKRKEIKNISPIPQDSILVTGDVVGLYPGIPHALPLVFALSKRTNKNISTEDLVKMANLLLRTTFWNFMVKINSRLREQ